MRAHLTPVDAAALCAAPRRRALPSGIDFGTANSARVLGFLLGSKDTFEVDRVVGTAMAAQLPTLPKSLRDGRSFLTRAAEQLICEAGVRQIIDIGCGYPTGTELHEVAHVLDPDTRVVYVDDDPLVAAHSRALRVTGDGRTAFVEADVADLPAKILLDPGLTAIVDLSRPVAVMLMTVLMGLDDDAARRAVRILVDALPVGSYVAIGHLTADWQPAEVQAVVDVAAEAGLAWRARTEAEVSEFFTGLELVEPGVVPMLQWRPRRMDIGRVDPHATPFWVGVGRTR